MHHLPSVLRHPFGIVWQVARVLALLLLLFPSLMHAQHSDANIVIDVSDAEGSMLAGADVLLKRGAAVLTHATTNQAGRTVIALDAGRYMIQVSLHGETVYAREVDLASGTQHLRVALNPNAREVVEVTATEADVMTDVSSPTAVLPVRQVEELPSRPKTALEALPLVPGVVRTYDGQLQIAGQGEVHSALLVDGVDESSPSSGRFSLSPPIDAVQTIHVETPSFLAQDGRFGAGVVRLETKAGGDRWHLDLNDPFPEFRIRSGHVRGVRSTSPRLVVGGPLVKDRVQFLESFGFIGNKIPVRTLSFPNNETKVLSSNSFTRVDAKLTATQNLTLSVQVAPQSVRYAGLDFFHPQSVTTNNEANTYVGSALHRLVYGNGFVQSTFSVGRYDESTTPQGFAPMIVRPEGNSGNFYKNTQQTSGRMEWNEAWTFLLPAHPQHQFTLGTSLAVVHGSGSVTERPVLIQTTSGTTAERIDFTGGAPFLLRDTQPAVYAQDHWTARKGLLIDYGIRLEGQNITGTTRAAPRVAFAWNDGKEIHATAVRGGIGVFYDNVPLNTFSFNSLPTQFITQYSGARAALQQYANEIGTSVNAGQRLVDREPKAGNFSPMTMTESIEIEHAWGPKLSTRARFLHSGSATGLTLTPSSTAPSFVLTDGGRLDYSQLEVTAKIELQKGFPLYGSYVRASSTGSLNSPTEVLSQTGGPFIRNTASGRQPSDLPNRFILWGSVRLPWQVTLTPQFEVHSGFVYQSLDVYQNFIDGAVRSQGRLPTYGSLDLRASKLVKLNAKYSLRPALSITNATNHFNGLEVHKNVADPQFGTPFGNNDRHERFDLDVVF